RYLVNNETSAVNPALQGTKAAVLYKFTVPAGGEVSIKLRLRKDQTDLLSPALGKYFDSTFAGRKAEVAELYSCILPPAADARTAIRQALAAVLLTKHDYHSVVRDWLNGDPAAPAPPPERKAGRNHAWGHIYNTDIISMPDKWEYPWYAAWDLAFHCVALAL